MIGWSGQGMGTVGGMAPSYIWYPIAILRCILGVGIT